MVAYLFRRMLLIIPTLFGIIAINFFVVQLAPGGPVEQAIAQLKGHGGSMGAGGGAAETAMPSARASGRIASRVSNTACTSTSGSPP